MISSMYSRHRGNVCASVRWVPTSTLLLSISQSEVMHDDRGRHKIRSVAGFSSWLERRQRGVEDLDEQVVSEFLRYRRRKGFPQHEAPPALRDLLESSARRRHHPLCSAREESPLHAIEQRFAQYLIQERGLAKPTIVNYLPIVRTFLSECFGSKPTGSG